MFVKIISLPIIASLSCSIEYNFQSHYDVPYWANGHLETCNNDSKKQTNRTRTSNYFHVFWTSASTTSNKIEKPIAWQDQTMFFFNSPLLIIAAILHNTIFKFNTCCIQSHTKKKYTQILIYNPITSLCNVCYA